MILLTGASIAGVLLIPLIHAIGATFGSLAAHAIWAAIEKTPSF
jgi:hypothetical protein